MKLRNKWRLAQFTVGSNAFRCALLTTMLTTVKDEPDDTPISFLYQTPEVNFTSTTHAHEPNLNNNHQPEVEDSRLVLDCIEVPTLALLESMNKKRKREENEKLIVKGLDVS